MRSSNQGVGSNIISIGNASRKLRHDNKFRLYTVNWENMTIYFLRHHHYKSGLSPSTSSQFINIFDGQYNKSSLTSIAISDAPYTDHHWYMSGSQYMATTIFCIIYLCKDS